MTFSRSKKLYKDFFLRLFKILLKTLYFYGIRDLNIPIYENTFEDITEPLCEGKILETKLDRARHFITIWASLGKSRIKAHFMTHKVVGNGSFGVVFQGTCLETVRTKAIKMIPLDKRFKNRELQTMRMMNHNNIVSFEHCFLSINCKQLFLNLVLEYAPETVFRISKHHTRQRKSMPNILVKLYLYQLCQALRHIHAKKICHRDIKPQNLLVHTKTHELKLCDFGSAKVLAENEPNISYICSRYYRAPELIFGATVYTTAIDIWSTGCVMAELMLGRPLITGESGIDQLTEIIKILGTPHWNEIHEMNPNYSDSKFPQIIGRSIRKTFDMQTPADALDIVSSFLTYNPKKRPKAYEALLHPFFVETENLGSLLMDESPFSSTQNL